MKRVADFNLVNYLLIVTIVIVFVGCENPNNINVAHKMIQGHWETEDWWGIIEGFSLSEKMLVQTSAPKGYLYPVDFEDWLIKKDTLSYNSNEDIVDKRTFPYELTTCPEGYTLTISGLCEYNHKRMGITTPVTIIKLTSREMEWVYGWGWSDNDNQPLATFHVILKK